MPQAAPASTTPIFRRFADAGTMLLVALACVALLIYIAYGTTKRTYEQMLVEKTLAQSELVRSPMETYLRPGLPLRQYTGFNQLANQMVEGDSTLVSMIVEASDGELVLSAGDAKMRTLPPSNDVALANGTLRHSDGILQVMLPLRNKFEQVGNLVVSMDRTEVDRRLDAKFRIPYIVALIASLSFAVVVFMRSASTAPQSSKPIAVAFTGAFLAVAATVVFTMVQVFTDGAQSKGRALIDSLGQRLDDIPQYGLQFDQLDGLDQILNDYRTFNPEIRSIGLMINGRIAVHTDRSRVGSYWQSRGGDAEYTANLTPPNHPRAALVTLSVPKSYVAWQVARSVKNYAALFVASALFAFLFLQLAQAMQRAQTDRRAGSTDWRATLALDLVKPVFFLAVFVDNLSYAFLPQVISELAQGSGDSSASIALPFTAYYLCFALALIPAGHYGQIIGTRHIVLGGLGLIAMGLSLMANVTSLEMAVVARALTGLGQGILFIGVQSYILAKSQREGRTRANGIIVLGFQGGMISGMAIGSLLVGEIGATGVFAAGALIAVAAIGYSLFLLPKDTPNPNPDADAASKVGWAQTAQLLRDPKFMQIILLIGIPAKAVLTGVVLFAMPLLLHAMGFAKEDIGQITMVYAGCVIVSSAIASHVADRHFPSRNLLVMGAFLTSAGLLVISFAGDVVSGEGNGRLWSVSLLVLGSAVIGLAHGLINAPVVTHITETAIANRVGQSQTAAAYRLLERAGHMIGPVIVGQLFLTFGTTPVVFAWLGAAFAIFAAAFHFINPAEHNRRQPEEFA